MKTKTVERRGWLRGAAECFPRLKLDGLLLLRNQVDVLAPGGSWQGGLGSAAGFKRPGLKYFGGGQDFAPWAAACARVLRLNLDDAKTPPPEGFPWLELYWDAESGKLQSAAVLARPKGEAGAQKAVRSVFPAGGPARRMLLSRARFSPELFSEVGLEDSFRQFDALCPVSGLVSECAIGEGGALTPSHAWSLQVRKAIPWPQFMRLDVCAPFSAAASQLSFILLDREVTEIGFTTDALWAWFFN
jgi:hypothetical protein